jgi:hypothetical protein
MKDLTQCFLQTLCELDLIIRLLKLDQVQFLRAGPNDKRSQYRC